MIFVKRVQSYRFLGTYAKENVYFQKKCTLDKKNDFFFACMRYFL